MRNIWRNWELETEYKDSPLGKIPKEWEIKRLNECCEIIQDGTHFSPKTSEGSYKYITSKHIKENFIELTNAKLISEKEHKKIYQRCPIKYGDVLFTKDGTIGLAALNNLTEEISLLSSVVMIRTNPSILLNIFLVHNILGPITQKEIFQSLTGTALKRITLNDTKKLRILLPPLPEQRKIAAILSSVDDAIQATKSVIEKTRRLKRGLMQQLLTRGIGHSEFKDSPLGKIPKVWDFDNMYKLMEIIKDGLHNVPPNSFSGIPVYSAQNIGEKLKLSGNPSRFMTEIDYLKIHKKFQPKFGDILLSIVGSIGATTILSSNDRVSFQRSVAILRPNLKNFNTEFLYYFLSSYYFQTELFKRQKISAQPGIYLGDLQNIPLICPPLPEQRKIAAILSSVDDSIQSHKVELERLQRLKKGLMQKLLTGKIRVKVD